MTFSVDDDVADGLDTIKGARITNLELGRVNASEIVTNALRDILKKVSPDSIARFLAKKREELRIEIESIESEAKQVLGTTIDEWLAHDIAETRSQADIIKAQFEIREKVLQEQVDRLIEQFSGYMAAHPNQKKSEILRWIKVRLQSLPALHMDEREFLEHYENSKKRRRDSPEVA